MTFYLPKNVKIRYAGAIRTKMVILGT